MSWAGRALNSFNVARSTLATPFLSGGIGQPENFLGISW
jgi:hypothetical protein